jgi:ribosomal protein L7/L12
VRLEEGGEWKRLALEGKKLEACKLYKQEMGFSLMEAKRAVESFRGSQTHQISTRGALSN